MIENIAIGIGTGCLFLICLLVIRWSLSGFFHKKTVLRELQDMQAAAEKEMLRLTKERVRALRLADRIVGSPNEVMDRTENDARHELRHVLEDLSSQIAVSIDEHRKYQRQIAAAANRIHLHDIQLEADALLEKARTR